MSSGVQGEQTSRPYCWVRLLSAAITFSGPPRWPPTQPWQICHSAATATPRTVSTTSFCPEPDLVRPDLWTVRDLLLRQRRQPCLQRMDMAVTGKLPPFGMPSTTTGTSFRSCMVLKGCDWLNSYLRVLFWTDIFFTINLVFIDTRSIFCRIYGFDLICSLV